MIQDRRAKFANAETLSGGDAADAEIYSDWIDRSSGLKVGNVAGDLGNGNENLTIRSMVQSAVQKAGTNGVPASKSITLELLSSDTAPVNNKLASGDKGSAVIGTIPVTDATEFLAKFTPANYKIPPGLFFGRYLQLKITIPGKVTAKINSAFVTGVDAQFNYPRTFEIS